MQVSHFGCESLFRRLNKSPRAPSGTTRGQNVRHNIIVRLVPGSSCVRSSQEGRREAICLPGGRRKGGRVRQRTLCYIGPLWKLVSGAPDDVRKKAEGFNVDWKKANDEIRQIPITFDELSEARRAQYALAIRMRRQGVRTQGDLPRAKGELSALSTLAQAKFREMFEEVGEGAGCPVDWTEPTGLTSSYGRVLRPY